MRPVSYTHLADRRGRRHFAQGIVAESRGRVALFRRDQVDQPVRKARQRRRVGLGGADVHVAKHLRRIDADDVAGQSRREFEGQRGLAAGGGADEEDGRRLSAIFLKEQGGRLALGPQPLGRV